MRKLLTNVGCRVKVSSFGLEDMEKIIYANDFLIEKIVNFFLPKFFNKNKFVFNILKINFILYYACLTFT